ncbi:MAG: glycosyltransferase family 2 protein [Bacteroidetes bacterium]|nr:glycosyltransferase family 2 protein [Bacteroidota bacterium]
MAIEGTQQAEQQKTPIDKKNQKGKNYFQHFNQTVYLSVIIPLLNEEESITELHQQLTLVLEKMRKKYELIFVDDGSTDNSFQVLQNLKKKDNKVKIIRFRRNFGKSAALMVGFKNAKGNFVITMDADLQDDPREIPSLIEKLKNNFDVVSGWKKRRFDPITKTIPSRFFNFVTRVMTGISIHDFNCGLKGYKREVIKNISVYGELHRYIPALAHWKGFSVGEVVVNHRRRKYGITKFGINRFFRGFLDLVTVLFTTRYFTRPLHLFGTWGLFSALIGIGVTLYLTFEKYFNNVPISNRPLFIVALIFIIVGVQFVSIGLLGELITKSQQTEKTYSIRDQLL